MRITSWLCSVTVLFQFLLPSFASAEDLKPQKIAILEVYQPGDDQELGKAVADRIRHDLAGPGSFRVLTGEETAKGLAQLGKEQGETGQDLSKIVQKATDAYYRMDLDLAKSILKKKLREVEAGGDLRPTEVGQIASAYLMLGMVHNAFRESTEAVHAFREVFRLAPDTVLSEREYPPRVRSLYSQAKKETLSQGRSGGIKVSSSEKKAEASIDGSFKGETPIEIDGLIAGRHYLLLRKSGFAPLVMPVDIPSGGISEYSLLLEEDASDTEASVAGFSLDGPESQENLVRKGVVAGQWLMVQQVVLIEVSSVKGFVSATIVDLSKPEAFQQKRALFSKPDEAIEEGSRLVLQHFSNSVYHVQHGNGFQPTVVEKKPTKKPFWKKPLVWIIGGVLLAGAGA
ncbi:MAG: PEGA domain-containing protein, partial [Deltaproteobacteria bacterium]|nr:PEGA domain-containing protein [Deltaproteobacteria bacterium]